LTAKADRQWLPQQGTQPRQTRPDIAPADPDALQQRRLAAAVLAHQEGHGRSEFQRLQVAHEWQRPGEARAIDRGVRPPTQG